MVKVAGKVQRSDRYFATVNLPLNGGRWQRQRGPSVPGLFVAVASFLALASQYYLYPETKHVSPSRHADTRPSRHQLQKCTDDDTILFALLNNDRWSERAWPVSRVDSLFNCDLPTALCTYYYPANFFDTNCGLGKEFAHFIKDMDAMKQNGTLWNHMPSMGFPTLTLDKTCVHLETHALDASSTIPASTSSVLKNIGQHNSKDGQHCLTERVSLLPVHKAGCSSLRKVFDFISGGESNAEKIRHKFFNPKRGPKSVGNRKRDWEFALNSLATATKYPEKEFASEQHVFFAVVRDPTERFISSIGQALGGTGSRSNQIGPVLKRACIEGSSSASKALKCLAHYVKDHGFWIELHFTPQVIDIAFTTMQKDVPISVLPFKELNAILTYFGNGNVWERNGSDEHYRSDSILTNMTVADYDEESLQIVCEIYEMDVRMQRSIGIQVPKCDPFIPHFYEFDNY